MSQESTQKQRDFSANSFQQGVELYRNVQDQMERFRKFREENPEGLLQLQGDDPAQFRSLCNALVRNEQELRTNKLFSIFPDGDCWQYNQGFDTWLNLKRENYKKHIAFANATKDLQYMAFFAGNRVGKTQMGAYMTACHLTGLYPDWWQGHKFKRPIQAWAVVENYESTKDPVQKMLFGRFFPGQNKTVTGDGMVPKSCISMESLQSRGGATADVLASVAVRHVTSTGRQNYSQLHFKSFEQSPQSFVGRAVDWIWIDQGPPSGIFEECCMRVVNTNGRVILTWTPLEGYTPVVQQFIPAATSFEKVFESEQDVVTVTQKSGLVMAGWKDIPHIPQAEMTKQIKHFKDTGQSQEMINARVKGIPHVGVGKIYTLPREELYFDKAALGRIPAHWQQVVGLDHGWRVTAAIWGAIDPESDVLYLYDEHYGRHKDVVHNAKAIRGRGAWIPVVIDPAAQQRQQLDGKRILDEYRNEGLTVTPAENAVEAGIEQVKARMHTGRLRVAKHLEYFWKEYDVYRRQVDEDKEDIAKPYRKDNHLMDAMRYLVVSGLKVAKAQTRGTRVSTTQSFNPFAPGEL